MQSAIEKKKKAEPSNEDPYGPGHILIWNKNQNPGHPYEKVVGYAIRLRKTKTFLVIWYVAMIDPKDKRTRRPRRA